MNDYSPNSRIIIVFRSIHDVIKSEKLIKNKGFDYQIVPVPTHLSSECGMCIEVNEDIINEMKIELKKNNIFHNIYSI
jgi:hypothetical protein